MSTTIVYVKSAGYAIERFNKKGVGIINNADTHSESPIHLLPISPTDLPSAIDDTTAL